MSDIHELGWSESNSVGEEPQATLLGSVEIINQMENEWSFTKAVVDEHITTLATPIVDEDEAQILNMIQNKTDKAPVGSRTLAVLKGIRNRATKNINAIKSVKKGNTDMLRRLFEAKMRDNDTHIQPQQNMSDTQFLSCQEIVTPKAVLRFDISEQSTPRIRTRSMGKVPEYPLVQPRTLEYQSKKKKTMKVQ